MTLNGKSRLKEHRVRIVVNGAGIIVWPGDVDGAVYALSSSGQILKNLLPKASCLGKRTYLELSKA